MLTLRQVSLDIMSMMGYNHDDAQRSLVAVMYNVKACIDKLKHDKMFDHLNTADQLELQNDLSVWTVDLSVQADRGWMYFDLPRATYSLPKDQGIDYIAYYRLDLPENCPPQVARVQLRPVPLSWMHNVVGSRYQFIDKSQPSYARATVSGVDRVYVFGVDPDIEQLEAGLFLSMPSFDTIDPDEPLQFEDERIHTLKRMVIDLERWALMIPQDRLRNDGRDMEPGQVTRNPPAVSQNDPIVSDK